MTAIFADLLAHLDKNELRYIASPDKEIVRFMLGTETATYSMVIKAGPDFISSSAQFPIRVPPGARSDISEAIVRANSGFKFGAFHLIYEAGEIQFNIFNHLETGRLSDEFAERLIGWSLGVLDAFTHAFLEIIYGHEEPERAIQRVEASRDAAPETPAEAAGENGEESANPNDRGDIHADEQSNQMDQSEPTDDSFDDFFSENPEDDWS